MKQEEVKKQFLENSVLDLPNLLLRPLSMEDLPDYHEYSSDPETLKYDYPAHENIEESRVMLIKWHLSNPAGRYGIFLKSEDKIIGNINFSPIDNEFFIGFTINKKYWRKGYGTEALTALANLAFQKTEIKQIMAEINTENQASKALLRKVGFQLKKSDQSEIYSLTSDK